MSKHAQAHWPALLPFELALGVEDLSTILQSHDIGEREWEVIQNNSTFRRELVAAHKEVAESGISFRRKAAIQAEMYLEELDLIMTSSDTPSSLKLEIFKTLVKYGELEPIREEARGPNSAFNIQINF